MANQAVVLSTGSRATIPKVTGLIETRPWTNRDATGAKRAPSSFAIMGDGAVDARWHMPGGLWEPRLL